MALQVSFFNKATPEETVPLDPELLVAIKGNKHVFSSITSNTWKKKVYQQMSNMMAEAGYNRCATQIK